MDCKSIDYHCPHCGQPISIAKQLFGGVMTCPACQKLCEIPLSWLEKLIKVQIKITGPDGKKHIVSHSEPQWERCIFCERKFDLNTLHPKQVKYFGPHPHVCYRCGLCFGPYGKIWSSDIEARICHAKATAGSPRKCFMCGSDYNLLGSFYRHMWYPNTEYPNLELPSGNPEWGYWVLADGIDFLYPNLFTEICPGCFQRLFSDNIVCEPKEQVAAVHDLGEKLGKLPAKNFPTYIYSYQDRDNIEWMLQLMRRLPSPELIKARFGSYFKLLLKSGLLPEGTRRMKLGTWVLSKDGDQCFSLAEREIDDWLFEKHIAHTKEVKYPNSDLRCDWEVFRDGKRIFIEYFGLMNQNAYAAKAELKRNLAAANGIILIGITPECDWEALLSATLLGTP